ncbi:hypothetical protein BJ170DRAFT_609022 [Xylariales sp. AK1849]|nr:hypothetical protein BJ170DRAFT_609022 [Xylariales sp. AK1849]
MEVALTFGSLGDIIAVCQLAIQLGKAIGVGRRDAGGSSLDYLGLTKDLELFVAILMQVVATYQQHELTPYLDSIDIATKSVVDECATSIQETLDHVRPKYHASLRAGGSGSKMRDTYRKIEWSIREKERMQHLRDRLRDGIERLSLLTMLAARKSARVDNATMLARIDEVRQVIRDQQTQVQQGMLAKIEEARRSIVEQQQQSQDKILVRIDEVRQVMEEDRTARQEVMLLSEKQARASAEQSGRLESVSNRLLCLKLITMDILGAVKMTFFAVLEVKQLLLRVSENVVNLQVLASPSTALRSLDPTKELQVRLETALGTGHVIEIPAQMVDYLRWDTLNKLLEDRFYGRKGYGMVLRREFALEESCSERDLDRKIPLAMSLRRGMRLNMSMIFANADSIIGACPRCRTVSDAPEGVKVQCQTLGCGMWFQVLRVRGLALKPRQDPRTWEGETGTLNMHGGRKLRHHHNLESDMNTKSSAARTIFVGDYDDSSESDDAMKGANAVEPSDFQRVRILRQLQARGGLKKCISKPSALPDVLYARPPSVSWNPRIGFHDTWDGVEYDRRAAISTSNRLTQALAQQIKEELNSFKLEMEVHDMSKIYTHFF